MRTSSQPVYLKLRDIIAAAIIDGTYGEGAMLPSVRAFAAEQGANPLTVAKAYDMLPADYYLPTEGRAPAHTARPAPPTPTSPSGRGPRPTRSAPSTDGCSRRGRPQACSVR